MPIHLDFMPGFWVLAMEREEMPTSDSLPRPGKARARWTVKRPRQPQEAANQTLIMDMPSLRLVEDRALAVGRVMAAV